jgi:hypothetical protein
MAAATPQFHSEPIEPGAGDLAVAARLRAWVREKAGTDGFTCAHSPLAGTDAAWILAWHPMVLCASCAQQVIAVTDNEACDVCFRVPDDRRVAVRSIELPGLIMGISGKAGILAPPVSIIYGVCDACAAA